MLLPAISAMDQEADLVDQFGRHISYLRVSVTEHCNFRCEYCSPEEGTPYFDRDDHLRVEEYDRLIGLFGHLGMRHIRFTGGEPLIYPHLLSLIESAKGHGIGKISVSTNGLLLGRLAQKLRSAGVNNLNISMDSLQADTFATITRGGDLRRVQEGIEEAVKVGIPRIKINVVLLRQHNGAELPALVDYAIGKGVDIRFIETMPLGVAGSEAQDEQYLSAEGARQRIGEHYPLEPAEAQVDHGPARLFRVPGTQTHVGFITPISDNFCVTCNRVRLTAGGRLVYCLGQEAGIDLLPLLRGGGGDEHIAEAVRMGIWHDKPQKHFFVSDPGRSARIFMMRLGG